MQCKVGAKDFAITSASFRNEKKILTNKTKRSVKNAWFEFDHISNVEGSHHALHLF